jgi:RNA polymerase sigma factor (TIGR02999 family)
MVEPAASREKSPEHSITRLLDQLRLGDRAAESLLVPQIYDELRKVAANHLRHERQGHTLQATALVNEAYMRLVDNAGVAWQSRAHFFAIASRVMHRILIDHARAKKAGKRGGDQQQITLEEPLASTTSRSIDVLALHELLERLEQLDPRQSQIVELHFFGGLSFEEIGLVVGVSDRTAKREWSMARAWLHSQLSPRA